MKLKIETPHQVDGTDIIMIKDIEEVGEHLVDDYGVRYGRELEIGMKSRYFLSKLKNSIKSGHVLEFKGSINTFTLDYLEEVAGELKIKTVELDISDCNEEFKKDFMVCISYYGKREKVLAGRTEKIFKRYINSDSPVITCYRTIQKSRDLSDDQIEIRPEDKTSIYHSLKKYYALWENMLIKKKTLSEGIMTIISNVVVIISGIMAFSSLGLALLLIILIFSANILFEIEKSDKRGIAEKILYSIEKKCSFDDPSKKNKKKSLEFIDLIEHDLDYCFEIDSEKLSRLAEQYSYNRSQWYFEGKDEPVLSDYLLTLIDIEMSAFDRPEEIELKKAKPFFKAGNLEQRLMILGYDKDKIKNDLFFQYVISAIEEISLKPYTGVERDILALMRLSIQYTKIEPISEEETKKLMSSVDFIRANSSLKREIARRNDATVVEEITPVQNLTEQTGKQKSFAPVKQGQI